MDRRVRENPRKYLQIRLQGKHPPWILVLDKLGDGILGRLVRLGRR